MEGIVRRRIPIVKQPNELYQFMKIVNKIRPDDLILTDKELDILYKFREYNEQEINTHSRDSLMDEFSFSSRTQVAAYISILFKKQAIFRSSTKAGVYIYSPYFFPTSTIPSEIVIQFVNKESNG